MRLKKPVKILLIVLVLVVGLPALAFVVFLYNPFEGSVGDIRKAVPRRIDFYLGKRNPSEDFQRFPRPWFWGDLERTRAFERLIQTELWKNEVDSPANQDLLTQVERVQDQLAGIPLLSVDIAQDLLGKDLLVAGRLDQGGRVPRFCAYAQVGWKLAAAISALDYDLFRNQVQGVRITKEDGLLKVQGRDPRPFWLVRVLDLAMIGNDKDLVQESVRLVKGEARQGEEGLLSTADYQDLVVRPLREHVDAQGLDHVNAADLYLDLETQKRLDPRLAQWPGPDDATSMEGRLFKAFVNIPAMKRLWGSVMLGSPYEGLGSQDGGTMRNVTALLRATMNKNELTRDQELFLEEARGRREWLEKILSNIPDRVAGFGAFRVSPTILLRQLYRSLDPDTRGLLDDGFRSQGVTGGAEEYLAQIAPAFEPWFAMVLIDNDPTYLPLPKEHVVNLPGPQPVFAFLFRITKGQEALVRNKVQELLKSYKDFGFTKPWRNPIDPAIAPEKEFILELSNPNFPATGHIALLNGADTIDNLFLISNHGEFASKIVQTRLVKPRTSSLKNDRLLRRELDAMPETFSGFLWLRTAGLRDILARARDFKARVTQAAQPEAGWAFRTRPVVEQRLFRERFSSRASGVHRLSPDDRRELDKLIEEELGRMWEAERMRQGAAAGADFREIEGLMAPLQRFAVVLQTSTKDLAVQLRAYLGF